MITIPSLTAEGLAVDSEVPVAALPAADRFALLMLSTMPWGPRLLSKIKITEGPASDSPCWLCGVAYDAGRAKIRIGRDQAGVRRRVTVYVAAWEALNGPVPAGLMLDHEVCSNPSCCNPNHLAPKSNRANTRRRHMSTKRPNQYGFVGAARHPRGKAWQARITVSDTVGKARTLSLRGWPTPSVAGLVYWLVAKAVYGDDFYDHPRPEVTPDEEAEVRAYLIKRLPSILSKPWADDVPGLVSGLTQLLADVTEVELAA